MKRLLLLGLTLIVLSSCEKEDKKPVKDYVVFSGKINNYRKGSFDMRGYNFEKKIKFNRKKKIFRDTLRGLKPGHYSVWIGRRSIQIYLDSTKDLKIKVDAKRRTKSPAFGGNPDLVKINKYLVRRLKKYYSILGNANKLFSHEEKLFLKKMKKYKSSLNKLLKKSKLPADYTEKEKRNIEHIYTRNLNNYEKFHGLLTGNEEFKASKKITSNITKVDLNNQEDYLFSFDYRALLKEYLESLAIKRLPEEDPNLDLEYVETVNDKVSNNFIKDDLLYNYAKSMITFTEDLPTFYHKVMSYSTDEENKEDIKKLYDKLKLTANGQPSPLFENYENYKGGKTSLKDLIGKGKYLYIDLWATWCGFCQKEVPLLKNFEEKYHGKNIEFVSINVDKKANYELWKKMIKDKEMGGVQLFAGNDIDHLDFAKKYLVTGLPKFILLDPNGKIISRNAPRPSVGYKLDELFEKHRIGE